MTFHPDFDNEAPCQVFIAITGNTRDAVYHALLDVLIDMDEHSKPIQGVSLRGDAIRQVVTPVWEGKKH